MASAPPYRRSSPNANGVDPPLPSPTSLITIAYSDTKIVDIEADMSQDLVQNDPNVRPKDFHNLFEEFIYVFTVMMATASTTFLQGAIIINTGTIGKDLHMTAAQMTWITAAIGLASGSFMLFFGKTADLLGPKAQLLAGMASLSLFSLITSFAPNAVGLDVLCGFLGLGTAAVVPPAIGTLFATYPEGRRRNKATGALGCGNPIGFVLGSISSGIATKFFGWRASFIVISVFFLVMTLLAFWTMPSTPRSGNVRQVMKHFDYFGAILTVFGMALLSAALTEGPESGWKRVKVILMVIIAFGCLFGFAVWEHIYKYPLLDPVVWENTNFTLCVLCVFFGYMSFITNQFWISLFMQEVQKFSPLQIAVRLLPQTFIGIVWSFVGQNLVHKLSGTILMAVGALGYFIGALLLIFIRENTSYWKFLFPSLLITVLGADFQFIVSNLYVTKQMPAKSSLAAGVLQTATRLSVSLGLAITAAVYGSVSKSAAGIADIGLPYQRAFLCSILFAVVGLCYVPFMKIAKQGDKVEHEEADMNEEDRSRTAGEYTDQTSAESKVSTASNTSTDSYLPRWSWEDERSWRAARDRARSHEPNVAYEVCIKCLEERRVTWTPMDNGGVEL